MAVVTDKKTGEDVAIMEQGGLRIRGISEQKDFDGNPAFMAHVQFMGGQYWVQLAHNFKPAVGVMGVGRFEMRIVPECVKYDYKTKTYKKVTGFTPVTMTGFTPAV